MLLFYFFYIHIFSLQVNSHIYWARKRPTEHASAWDDVGRSYRLKWHITVSMHMSFSFHIWALEIGPWLSTVGPATSLPPSLDSPAAAAAPPFRILRWPLPNSHRGGGGDSPRRSDRIPSWVRPPAPKRSGRPPCSSNRAAMNRRRVPEADAPAPAPIWSAFSTTKTTKRNCSRLGWPRRFGPVGPRPLLAFSRTPRTLVCVSIS